MATNTPAPAAPEKPADFQKQVKDVESWIRYWRRRFKPQDGSAAFSPAMMNQQKQLQKQNLDVLKQLLQNQTQKSQVVFVKNEYNHEKLDPTEIKKRMEFDRSVSTELNNLLDDIRGSLFDVNSEVEFDTRLNHIREEKLENLLELQRQLTEIKTEDELSGPYLKQIAGSIARINATLKETQDALIKKQNLGQTNQPKINITLGNSEPFPTSPNAMAGYSMANASSDSLGLIGAAAMSFVFLRHFAEMAKGIGKKFSQSNKLAAYGSAKLFTNTGRWVGDLADFMTKKTSAFLRFPSIKKWSIELIKKIGKILPKNYARGRGPVLGILGTLGLAAGTAYGTNKVLDYFGDVFDPEKSNSMLAQLFFLDKVRAVKLGGNDGEALKQMLQVFSLTKGLLFGEEIGKAIKKGYIDRRVFEALMKSPKYATIFKFDRFTVKGIWDFLRGKTDRFGYLTYQNNKLSEKIIKNLQDLQKEINRIPKSKNGEIIKEMAQARYASDKMKLKMLDNIQKRIDAGRKKAEERLKNLYKTHNLVDKTPPPKGLIAKIAKGCKFIGKALKKIPWFNGGFLIYDYIRYVRQRPFKAIREWREEFSKPDGKYNDLDWSIKYKILNNMERVGYWWLADLGFQVAIFSVNVASTVFGPLGMLTVGAVTTLVDILYTKFRDWKLGFKMADCDFDNPLTFINPKELINKKGLAWAKNNNLKIDQDTLDEAYGDSGAFVVDAKNNNIDFKSSKITLNADDYEISLWKFRFLGAEDKAQELASFSTYALVRYLGLDSSYETSFFKRWGNAILKLNKSFESGEFSFNLPGYTEDFLFLQNNFSMETFLTGTSHKEYTEKLMASFGGLKFLSILFNNKEYLNSLLNSPGLDLKIFTTKWLRSYDYLKEFNVKSEIPVPNKLKEWLPKGIFAFYVLMFLKPLDKIFEDYEKTVLTVAKYFIKDYEKLIPGLKESAKQFVISHRGNDVNLDMSKIKEADVNSLGKVNEVDKVSVVTTAGYEMAIFEASEKFFEKYDKVEDEKEKRKYMREFISAKVSKELRNEFGSFNPGYLTPALTQYIISNYTIGNEADIEKAVKEAIEKFKKITGLNKNNFGDASKKFLNVTQTVNFLNDAYKEDGKFDEKALTSDLESISANISEYVKAPIVSKDSSAANIGKPNTTPDSAPYQDPSPGPAPSVSPNETEMIGAAPEIKVPDNGIWIQGKRGKINVLENKTSNGFCARGVKTILNKMFNVPYFNGHAWQVPNDPRFKENFTEIQKPSKFQNGDVYVIGTYENNPYGHIAVFLNGGWYSDFVQGPLINVYRHSKKRPLTDAKQESLTKYYRPKKYLNGAPTVKISGIPSSSYNANISKPESNASEFEGKLNGNENQPENKAETVVVKTQENKDSQPVNTHGMAEELFLIKIDNLGFVC